MAKKNKPVPMPMPVSVELDGKTYHGTYTVSGGIITVSSSGGSKPAGVQGSSAGSLARLILIELVREGKA